MASSTSRPAIVLVHGTWHPPITYTNFTSALHREGYDVHVPYLPSCTGSRPPTASLPEDTVLVRRLVEMLADQGRSIIVVVHSAVRGRGLTGGVVHLLAICAHVHPEGFSVMDIVHEMGHTHLIPLAFDIADDDSCFPTDARAALFSELPRPAEPSTSIVQWER